MARAIDKSTPSDPIERLPFIGRRKHPTKDQMPRDFWHNVKSTGDWGDDCRLGAQYAYQLLRYMNQDREMHTPVLGNVVCDMIENECPHGIAVGFFQIIAEAATLSGNFAATEATRPSLASYKPSSRASRRGQS